MGRRNKKNKPKVFSTSLLDMLFCAFGSMYTLFVVGAALLSSISINMPVLLTAQIIPENELSEHDTEKYFRDSYLTFSINDEYLDETSSDTIVLAHYGYLNNKISKKPRKSFLFLNDGIGHKNNNFHVFAENLDLPLLSSFNEDQKHMKVNLKFELFISGKKFMDQEYDKQVTLIQLYTNQLPSSKENMEPLFDFKFILKNDEITIE